MPALFRPSLFGALLGLLLPALAWAQAKESAPPAPPAAAPAPALQAPPKVPSKLRPKAVEPPVPQASRKAILANPVLQRLSTVSGRMRFGGGAKGAARWHEQAIGAGRRSWPLRVPLGRGQLNVYATDDGARLWLASATFRDSAAVLRLGDLLPLLAEIGIQDREASLAIRQVSISGGMEPPSYTLAFRTGALWKHREKLAAAEASGRAWYSHVTGQLTVLGVLVLSDAKGELSVKRVSPDGEQKTLLQEVLLPAGCTPFETALRSASPTSALAVVDKALAEPSITQACAGRYLALTGAPDAADRLRRTLAKQRIAWPAELVEALASLDPQPGEQNLKAVTTMIRKRGPVAAEGVCRGAPLSWLDALLADTQVTGGNREILRRCAWK